MGFKRLSVAISIGLMAVVALPSLVSAEPSVVSEVDFARQAFSTSPTKSWVIYTSGAGSSAVFRTDPPLPPPPAGLGSLVLNTSSATDKVAVFNYEHKGKLISTIDTLVYNTLRVKGAESQIATLNLEVDMNGDVSGGLTTLVFDPAQNQDAGDYDQADVVTGQWQRWDALNFGGGRWRATTYVSPQLSTSTYISWGELVTAYGDAVIVGGFGVNQDLGNDELTTVVDKISINEFTYDFENIKTQPTRATNKEQCMNNGYKNFGDMYKNQGTCVSDVVKNENASKE